MSSILFTELPVASDRALNPLTEAALYGITRALASEGRAFICLDPTFTIRHVSPLLDKLLCEGASKAKCGRHEAAQQIALTSPGFFSFARGHPGDLSDALARFGIDVQVELCTGSANSLVLRRP